MQTLALQSAVFFQRIDFSYSVLGKNHVLIWSLRRFCHTLFFQSKMCEKFIPGRFFRYASYFERVLYCKIGGGFRCEHCSFEVWVQWCCVIWNSYVWPMETIFFVCNFCDLSPVVNYSIFCHKQLCKVSMSYNGTV